MGSAGQGKNSDVRQVTVALGIVEPVTDDKFVRNDKADIIGSDIGDAAFSFVQERRDFQALWLSLLQNAQQILQGQPGVEDVFHNQDYLTFDAGVQVLVELDLAGGFGVLAVAGYGDEINRDFPGNLSRKVGQEQYRALQNTNQKQGLAGKIRADPLAHFTDFLLNLAAGDQRADALPLVWRIPLGPFSACFFLRH